MAEKVQERDVSTDERQKLASKGKALPGGSFPIASISDLKNAIQAFGRAKNKAAAKRHIIKRAGALGATHLIPAGWREGVNMDTDKKDDELEEEGDESEESTDDSDEEDDDDEEDDTSEAEEDEEDEARDEIDSELDEAAVGSTFTKIITRGPNKGDKVKFKVAPSGKPYPVQVLKDAGGDSTLKDNPDVKFSSKDTTEKHKKKKKKDQEAIEADHPADHLPPGTIKRKKKKKEVPESSGQGHRENGDFKVSKSKDKDKKKKTKEAELQEKGFVPFKKKGKKGDDDEDEDGKPKFDFKKKNKKDMKKKTKEAIDDEEPVMAESEHCHDESCGYDHIESETLYETAPDMEMITESSGVINESLGDEGNVYKATLLQSGVSKNRNFWSADLLRSSFRMFEGAKAFADHPTRREAADRPERSVRDLIGWYEGVKFVPNVTGGKITANFHVLEGPVAEIIRQAHARGKGDLVQLSVNISGKRRPRMIEGTMVRDVEELNRVHSVDAVTEASAGGSIDQIAASERTTEEVQHLMDLDKVQPDEVRAILKEKPELLDAVRDLLGAEEKTDAPQDQSKVEESKKDESSDDDSKIEEKTEKSDADPKDEVVSEATQQNEVKELLAEIRKERALATSASTLDSKLKESGLPDKVQTTIRAKYAGKAFESADLDTEIATAKDLVTSVSENAIPSEVPWDSSDAGKDKLTLAMDGLVRGTPQKDDKGDIVTPFKSLRHAYSMITGRNAFDQTGYEVLESARGYDSGYYNQNVGDGRFQEATAMLRSNFGDGTLNKVLGDSITRAALMEYKFPALNEWRKIVRTTSVSDLRKQLREQVGEFTLIEDVAENAGAYPDLTATALPNQEAFYQAAKRGGNAALTLEAIINDDLRALQNIPKKLGRSAAGRIYRFVFDLLKTNPAEDSYFTGGSSSITLVDTAALRDPGNLVTDTVSTNGSEVALNDANLSDADIKFRIAQAATTAIPGKTTHSFLAAEPKFLITAPTNRATALKLLQGNIMYATDQSAAADSHEPSINIHANSLELIVVPYWEVDSNVVKGSNTLAPKSMWFVTASPNEASTIEVGFLNGRDDPEIFVQNMETVGSMFDKDVVTWKLRHFWDANIMDHRGIVGATVS